MRCAIRCGGLSLYLERGVLDNFREHDSTYCATFSRVKSVDVGRQQCTTRLWEIVRWARASSKSCSRTTIAWRSASRRGSSRWATAPTTNPLSNVPVAISNESTTNREGSFSALCTGLIAPFRAWCCSREQARLQRAWQSNFAPAACRKTYHALVEGTGVPAQGECIDWLLKDRERNIVRRVKAGTPGARKCVLSFRRLAVRGSKTLVEIVPLTGRSHQIRVQLAALGHPIVGDRKYGSRSSSRGTIALHAASLTFEHPVLGNSVTLIAADPAAWKKL